MFAVFICFVWVGLVVITIVMSWMAVSKRPDTPRQPGPKKRRSAHGGLVPNLVPESDKLDDNTAQNGNVRLWRSEQLESRILEHRQYPTSVTDVRG